ncbi:H-type lectin domain-containing protein [Aspergillus oryzae]|uniref:H-type lectin domain-containing protein n=1 Tax=Aspergillus oryzae TaxID=5062 RepID=A0A1S9DT70_ASPOZ|nr:H-type lectin domain-containing protein [Aspergillus oryzae]GMG26395.1 unnamed protein product [Aspergillus oryzae]
MSSNEPTPEVQTAEIPRRVNTCVILQTKDERSNPGTTLPERNRVHTEHGYALALDRSFYWSEGAEVHVRFLDGDSETHKEVERIAREWETVANIHFVFDNDAKAPVRITFSQAGGGWSALGHDCTTYSLDEATMGIGVQKDSREFKSTVLHEFGHVLGCVHEHSSPVADIKWKKDKLYQHYKNKWGWSEAEVNKQILHRYSPTEVEHTAMFDDKSIMIYPIDPYVVKDAKRIPLPKGLSPGDRELIRQCYPNPEIPETVGVFYSWDYQRWRLEVPRNIARVTFPATAPVRPKIAVALVEFDLHRGKDLRMMTDVEDVTREGFHIRTKTWDDSIMYSAGAMWFKQDDPGSNTFQAGILDTDDQSYDLRNSIKENVSFDEAFQSPPKVVVFLRGFHLGHDTDWELSVTTGAVEKDGFELCISCGPQTKLYRAIVTWIAYDPSNNPNIFSGTVNAVKENFYETSSTGGGRDARRIHRKTINLRKQRPGCTGSKFRVYAAINAFHFSCADNLRLHVETEKNNDQEDRFRVLLKTWNTSVSYSAGASYLVVYE